jgi:hypothetical protein
LQLATIAKRSKSTANMEVSDADKMGRQLVHMNADVPARRSGSAYVKRKQSLQTALMNCAPASPVQGLDSGLDHGKSITFFLAAWVYLGV